MPSPWRPQRRATTRLTRLRNWPGPRRPRHRLVTTTSLTFTTPTGIVRPARDISLLLVLPHYPCALVPPRFCHVVPNTAARACSRTARGVCWPPVARARCSHPASRVSVCVWRHPLCVTYAACVPSRKLWRCVRPCVCSTAPPGCWAHPRITRTCVAASRQERGRWRRRRSRRGDGEGYTGQRTPAAGRRSERRWHAAGRCTREAAAGHTHVRVLDHHILPTGA